MKVKSASQLTALTHGEMPPPKDPMPAVMSQLQKTTEAMQTSQQAALDKQYDIRSTISQMVGVIGVHIQRSTEPKPTRWVATVERDSRQLMSRVVIHAE